MPVWDIADRFGPDTNMLVTDMEQARDLARMPRQEQRRADARARLLGGGALADRGGAHGGLRAAQRARADERAAASADITPLPAGEIAARDAGYKPYSLETRRAWRYWAHKAGCAHLVEEHPIDHPHKPWGSS